jgi:hypothetical protein
VLSRDPAKPPESAQSTRTHVWPRGLPDAVDPPYLLDLSHSSSVSRATSPSRLSNTIVQDDQSPDTSSSASSSYSLLDISSCGGSHDGRPPPGSVDGESRDRALKLKQPPEMPYVMFVDSVWDGVAHRFPNATATELRQRVNDMWKALPAEERAGLIKKYLGQKVPFFFFPRAIRSPTCLFARPFFCCIGCCCHMSS